MNPNRAKSLLAAYAAKGPDIGEPKLKLRSVSPEIRMVLILAVFDDRSAKWAYEFLIEQGELASEAEPKKAMNQIRKISGWISKIRVEDMKLPPLCKGLIQPPDMAKARQRWDEVNHRPGDEEILSGKWMGIAVDFSDLDLSPPQGRGKLQTATTKAAKSKKEPSQSSSPVSTSAPEIVSLDQPDVVAAPNAEVAVSPDGEEIPMNELMQKFAEKNDNGEPLYTHTKKVNSFHATLPTAFKH